MKVKLNAPVYALRFKDAYTHHAADGEALPLGPERVLMVYENGDYDLQPELDFRMAGHMCLTTARSKSMSGLYLMTSAPYDVVELTDAHAKLTAESLNEPTIVSRAFFDMAFVAVPEEGQSMDETTSGAIDLVETLESMFTNAKANSGLPLAHWVEASAVLL